MIRSISVFLGKLFATHIMANYSVTISESVSIDDKTQLVLNALKNSNSVWRTLEGIERDTGLQRKEIEDALHKISRMRLLAHAVESGTGRDLYTTVWHYGENEKTINKILSSLSGSYRA